MEHTAGSLKTVGTSDGLTDPQIVFTTPEPVAELERLGDEIAELAAQLDAATSSRRRTR